MSTSLILGEYITDPIRIRLLEGVYRIDTYVRINTASDFTIEGEGADTEIIVDFDIKNPTSAPHWNNSHKKGTDCIVGIFSPWENEIPPGLARDNSLTIKNLSLRFSEGIKFPYFKKGSNGEDEEQVIGVLMSYSCFHKVEIKGLDMEATKNGEVTLINGDECDHLKITESRLCLDNWNDRTDSEFEKRREQGTNLNVRGNNSSVLIAGNTFVKHGNDETLSFFATLSDDSSVVTHENISVVWNTFTYVDADPVNDTGDGSEETDGVRPMHVNTVFITFNTGKDKSGNDIRSIWNNVLFADNTLNLEGPVVTAVAMNVLPSDVCRNVSFERNMLFHTYTDTHQLPGNGSFDGVVNGGALPYVYSNSFAFKRKHDSADLVPGTRGHTYTAETEIEPTPVVYRGNYIRYTQKTYDQPRSKNTDKYYSYEHSCFVVYGGDIEIIDNYIDGSGSVVTRYTPSDGVYGNVDNPVTLFHCFPCELSGNCSLRISGNEAVKYGVAFSSRQQYMENVVNKGYSIHLENNTFNDGAATVLYNMKDSNIAVVRNSFTGCTLSALFKAVVNLHSESQPANMATDIKIFQNKMEAHDKYYGNMTGKLLEADIVSGRHDVAPVTDLCFMLNWLPGYSTMTIDENAVSQTHISNNLYTEKGTGVCDG